MQILVQGILLRSYLLGLLNHGKIVHHYRSFFTTIFLLSKRLRDVVIVNVDFFHMKGKNIKSEATRRRDVMKEIIFMAFPG